MYNIGVIIDPHLSERAARCRKDNYLETCLNKLEYVAKNNDSVIICGDLFHLHANSTLFFNTVHTLFSKYRGKFHAIPGNHDVLNHNLNTLNRTTLGSLYYTGVLNLHLSGWDLYNIHFEPCLINQSSAEIPVDYDNSNILIAHKFFNNPFNLDESLSPEDINKLGYKTVFLGHDHKPYPDEFIGNSQIIRMGSLTRSDVQKYNKDREIVYYQISTDGCGEYTISRKVIPHAPAVDCYIEEAYRRMCSYNIEEPPISFSKISEAISKFTKSSMGSNSLNMTLLSMGTPKNSIDDIKWRHEINGVQYT